MAYTWGEIKLESIKKMFLNNDIIQITDLNKSFGTKKVLENLNCTIKTGSIYGLIGANGAGKSTLLRIIMGIFRKDSGKITIDDKELLDDEYLLLTKIIESSKKCIDYFL